MWHTVKKTSLEHRLRLRNRSEQTGIWKVKLKVVSMHIFCESHTEIHWPVPRWSYNLQHEMRAIIMAMNFEYFFLLWKDSFCAAALVEFDKTTRGAAWDKDAANHCEAILPLVTFHDFYKIRYRCCFTKRRKQHFWKWIFSGVLWGM